MAVAVAARVLLLLTACARAASTAAGLPVLKQAVHVRPSDCTSTAVPDRNHGDCYAVLASAVDQCRKHGPGCAVVLASGTYIVRCPRHPRPSSAHTEAPAVSLAGLRGPMTFGGLAGSPRPVLLVDYINGGCAGVVAENLTGGVFVQHLVIDALRLPYTVGTVIAVADGRGVGTSNGAGMHSNGTTVRFRPEQPPQPAGDAHADDAHAHRGGDRAGVYEWDTARWPWLATPFVRSQVVPAGSRATREMPDAGLSGPHVSVANPDGTVTLTFAPQSTSRARARLTPGQRLFIQHFENMQSWGVHGRNVSCSASGSAAGNPSTSNGVAMAVVNVTLYSTCGMGFRCDLCDGRYLLMDSSVAIKPGTQRPMSITADATHFMHHRGEVELTRVNLQGQGDDAFNSHGNFIVLDGAVEGGNTTTTTAHYIDETGPGWITAAPTLFVGDTVEFYSRRTLQRLGEAGQSRNTIVDATPTTVTFARPLPAGLKRYDMFISTSRISNLKVYDSFFGNSNARGLVVSAENVTVRGNTFANLSLAGVIFFEGGCGAQPPDGTVGGCPWCGDYTEGPFSRNVLLESNTFLACAWQAATGIANRAAVQFAGCHPVGACGLSGGGLASTVSTSPSARGPPVPTRRFTAGSVVRVERVELGGVHALPVAVTGFRYYDHAPASAAPLAGCQMGIYAASSPAAHAQPAALLARVDSGWVRRGSWVEAQLPNSARLSLTNGSYFVAHWFPTASGQVWLAAAVTGTRLELAGPSASDGLPSSGGGGAGWATKVDSGLSVAVSWEAVGGWCDDGGTLPPPVVRKPDDPAAGRITERGALLQGGQTVFSNVTVRNNTFVAPSGVWENSFLHVGAVRGLVVANNTMSRPLGTGRLTGQWLGHRHRHGHSRGPGDGADIVLYSSTNITAGPAENNRCYRHALTSGGVHVGKRGSVQEECTRSNVPYTNCTLC